MTGKHYVTGRHDVTGRHVMQGVAQVKVTKYKFIMEAC